MALLPIVGVLVLLVAFFVGYQLREQKRSQALQAEAVKMNFTYSETGGPQLLDELQQFHLFKRGRSRKIRNVLRGRAGDMDVLVFDYRYRTGGGNNSRTWRQTVILFQSDDLAFPQFTLRPEHVFHKLGQVLGYQDIDFDSHPVFSKRYLLRGDSEENVRSLFDAAALEFYERDGKLSTEAAGSQLIHYRSKKRTPPEKLSDFIREGVQVLTLLRS